MKSIFDQWGEASGNPSTPATELHCRVHRRVSIATSITIVTDSAYVKDGITKWIHGWKRNNWTKKGGLKNVDLWQRLDAAATRHQVRWEWVKGHAGHPENERADALARAGMAPFKP